MHLHQNQLVEAVENGHVRLIPPHPPSALPPKSLVNGLAIYDAISLAIINLMQGEAFKHFTVECSTAIVHRSNTMASFCRVIVIHCWMVAYNKHC